MTSRGLSAALPPDVTVALCLLALVAGCSPAGSCQVSEDCGDVTKRCLDGECVPACDPSVTCVLGGVDAGPRIDAGPAVPDPDAGQPDDPDAGVTPPPDDAGSGPAPWLDDTHGRRRLLTIDTSAFTEALLEFPVLVRLDVPDQGGDRFGPAGEQIEFFDEDGTELSHEIDTFDPQGDAAIWVKLPEMPLGSSTALWLYYDAPDAVVTTVPSRVWSEGYRAVYHLNDGHDSAGNLPDATLVEAPAVEGVVGDARQLDGLTSEIDLGVDLDTLSGVPGASLSAWVQLVDTTLAQQTIVAFNAAALVSGASRAQLLVAAGGGIEITGRSTEGELAQGAVSALGLVLPVTWTRLDAVFDFTGDRDRVHVDGALIVDEASAYTADTSAASRSARGVVGSNEDGAGRMQGLVDEVRVAGVARTEGWVFAEHATVDLPGLVDVGDEEQEP